MKIYKVATALMIASGLNMACSSKNGQTGLANPTSAIKSVNYLSEQGSAGVTITVSPGSVGLLTGGQTMQLSASIVGSSNTSVNWSLNYPEGSISANGLYMAPASVSTWQTVTAIATSAADPTASVSIPIPLQPGSVAPAVVVGVQVSPTAPSLMSAGQTLQLTASISGSPNTSVVWSLNYPEGSISQSGVYTAPSSISTWQTVTATATSVADSTKSASVAIPLMPGAEGVSVSISPSSSALLSAGQTLQLSALVSGSQNTSVVWSLNYPEGSISQSGVYTAPSNISNWQTVTAIATSVADPTIFSSVAIPLMASVVAQPQPSVAPMIAPSPTPVVQPTIAPVLGPVSISVSPASVGVMSAGQTIQLNAAVGGSSNTAVTWSLNYPEGSISQSGLYTAPLSISNWQTVTAIATSSADSSKSVSVALPLSPSTASASSASASSASASPGSSSSSGSSSDSGSSRNVASIGPVTPTSFATFAFTQTPASNSTLTDDVIAFSVTGSSGLAQTQCSLDSVAFTYCSSPFALTLSAGAHSFQVQAVDAQNNVIGQSTVYNWSVTIPVTTPGTIQQQGWVACAMGGENCQLPNSGPQQILYGATPDPWGYNKVVNFSGVTTVACQDSSFGGNPNPVPYNTNYCWYWGTQTVSQPNHPLNGPFISLPLDGLTFPGSGLQRVQPAAPGIVPDPSFDGTGDFRDNCSFSHFSFDNPIQYPGQPGADSLNMFFGNTGANAYSTSTTLQTSGTSTCGGGILNRSAYWVPAMINTQTGQPVRATTNNAYYKSGYFGISPSQIHPLPKGLVMISGLASNSVPGANEAFYSCNGGATPNNQSAWTPNIPNCADGAGLVMEVFFPQCWDGVNLDSPDHMSHMSFTVNGACPATHPVAIPEISFNVHYTSLGAQTAQFYQLSSDTYNTSNGNAGYSGHAGYMYGWDDTTMQTFIQNCTSQSIDCHDFLLGNGMTLY